MSETMVDVIERRVAELEREAAEGPGNPYNRETQAFLNGKAAGARAVRDTVYDALRITVAEPAAERLTQAERRRWMDALACAVDYGQLSVSAEAAVLASVNGYCEDDPAASVLDETYCEVRRMLQRLRARTQEDSR